MSSVPSTQDARTTPQDKSDADPLSATVPVVEAITCDMARSTGATPTVDMASTADPSAHADTVTTAKGKIRSRPPQPTKPLSLIDNKLSEPHVMKSSIHTGFGNLSTEEAALHTVSLLSPRQDANESTNTIPGVKPLGISDLPNEILDRVLFYLSRPDKGPSTWKQDIKNTRLSCRLFSANASRYLIRNFRMDLSEDSLAKLETICNHPDIRHGVRLVQVCLAQYDDGFAGDLEEFASHMSNVAHHEIESQEMESKAEFIVDTWGRYLEARGSQEHTLLSSFDLKEASYIQALLDGYRLYQRGLAKQRLLLDGGFATRVSASMVKLPAVKHLEVTDLDTIRWNRCGELGVDFSNNESLAHSLSQCRSQFGKIKGNTLQSLIPNLICTVTGITTLSILISPRIYSCTELALLNLREDQLRSSLRNLRSFRFDNNGFSTRDRKRDPQGFRPLARFLDACLESESLESIFISAKISSETPLESFISPRHWPKLKCAELRWLPTSKAVLDTMADSIACRTEGSMSLDSVELSGGTWASVLDMLRSKRIRLSLHRPKGAELGTIPIVWYEEIFCPNSGSPSFAEFYVQGEDMPNPILDHPSEELRDKLLGLDSSSEGGPDVDGYTDEMPDEGSAA